MSPANMQPDVISYNASISALEKTFDRKRLEAFLSEAKGERCMAFCHGLLSGTSLKVGPSQLVKLDDPCALSLRTRCVLHEPPM